MDGNIARQCGWKESEKVGCHLFQTKRKQFDMKRQLSQGLKMERLLLKIESSNIILIEDEVLEYLFFKFKECFVSQQFINSEKNVIC